MAVVLMGEGFGVGVWVKSGLVVGAERCGVAVVLIGRGFAGMEGG